jgi:predicted RNA-binding protein with PIN domain
MTNKIIIDGWNLIWQIPEISKYIPDNLAQARASLNQRIKSYYQQKKVFLKIIYDGKSGIVGDTKGTSRIDIRFSKDPEKADHLIINFLRREKRAADWTVVTSDCELSMRIKNTGAKVISSEAFLSRIKVSSNVNDENPKKNNPNMSKEDMDYWLNIFKE